jgi:4'-phosphopantetheinyl transferase
MTGFAKAWLFDIAALDDTIAAQWLEQLSAAEQQRANTFKHAARRNSYIASHVLAYQALQHFFGHGIKDYIIASEGEPLLSNISTQQPSPARLSISHSGNYILCAISNADTLIGCDIENHKSRSNALAIARQFFTNDEHRQLQKLAENHQTDELEKQFYRMWTGKEAWLKAQGLGIANGLKKISFFADQFNCSDSDEASWQLYNTQYDNHSLAIAIKKPPHITDINLLIDRIERDLSTADLALAKTESLAYRKMAAQ